MDTAEKLFTLADGDGIENDEESVNDNTDSTTTDARGGARRSTREKTQTQRMKEYRLQLLERDFLAAQRACTRQVNKIPFLLEEEVNLRVLQQERGKLEARMEDLTNAHEGYFATLKCEEKTERTRTI